MKLHLILVLTALLLYSACEKETSTPAPPPPPPGPTHDFRDSFVGTYVGTMRKISRAYDQGLDSTWIVSDTTYPKVVIVSYEIDDSLSYYTDPPSYHEQETFPAIRIDGGPHAVDTSGDFRTQFSDDLDYAWRGLFIKPDSMFRIYQSFFGDDFDYTHRDTFRAVRQ